LPQNTACEQKFRNMMAEILCRELDKLYPRFKPHLFIKASLGI